MQGLGRAFQNILPQILQQPGATPPIAPVPAPVAPVQPQRLSKGQLILGVLADALAGAQGRPGQFAAMQGQRRQEEREEVQWQNRRRANLEDYGVQQQLQRQYAPPPAMVQNVQAWMNMTEPQRAAHAQMQQAQRGDPDVVVTLPGNRIYAGPRSGLTEALMGGGQALNQEPAPTVGARVPDPRRPRNSDQGGPASQAPGTFRP